jgi:1-acyl-sn-glycerol-3-phosphate acyltransferase
MHESMTLRQAVRIALAAGAFVGFGLGGALLSWIVLPMASIDPVRRRRQRRCQRVVQKAFVLFHDYMRVCDLVAYDPRRAPRVLPETPCVVVTNHPTLIDVTALIAAYGELCVVAKAPLFYNPLVGPLLRLCGHINGGRGGFGTTPSVIEEIGTRLRGGHRVLIFPEGTRSSQTGLRRFRSGAFRAAFDVGVQVVPIAIRAEPPGLRKEQAWHEIPTTAIALTFTPMEPLSASAYACPRDLMHDARDQIVRALQGS